jgi:hypothetical protein
VRGGQRDQAVNDVTGQRDRPGGAARRTATTRPSPPGSTLAPWSEETVRALNAFQQSGRWHPFTCQEDRHAVGGDGVMPRPVLVATPSGWSCSDPGCDQDQHWAWTTAIRHGAWLLDPENEKEKKSFFTFLTDEEMDLS